MDRRFHVINGSRTARSAFVHTLASQLDAAITASAIAALRQLHPTWDAAALREEALEMRAQGDADLTAEDVCEMWREFAHQRPRRTIQH